MASERRAGDRQDQARALLEEELQSQLQLAAEVNSEIERLQRCIEGLRNLGSPVRYSSAVENGGLASSVTPGQYKGMPLKLALEPYMKARGGGKLKVDEVVRDLLLGGAAAPPSHKPAQALKIKLGQKNSGMFGYDRATGEVWLTDKAFEPRLGPNRPKKKPKST